MIEFDKFEAQIIAVLSDNIGHCNWEFADLIAKQKGRSKKILQSMEERQLIYRGNSRKTTNPEMKGKEYHEVPYFIHPNFTDYERQGQIQTRKGLDLISSVIDDLAREYESAEKKHRNDLDSHFDDYALAEKSLKSTDVDLSSKRARFFDHEEARKNRDTESFQYMREEQQKILDLQERLLNSTFADGIFEKCEFMKVYQVLKKHLSNEEFRTLASRTMLTKPFAVAEYAKIPDKIKEYFDESYHQTFMPYLGEENLITILKDFDPSIAVRFCRDNLRDELAKTYRDEAGTLGVKTADFVGLDMHLSPFISYPLNYPLSSLLKRPFERLFSDIYIFNEDDLKKLVRRAHIFYSRFPEILSMAADYEITLERELISWEESSSLYSKSIADDIPNEYRDRCNLLLGFKERHIESFARQAIFYWNITSHKLDWVVSSLKNAWEDESEREFYVKNTQRGIYIRDLRETRCFGESNLLMDTLLFDGYFLCESNDLFAQIRPCSSFAEIGLSEKPIASDEIISRFKMP